MKSVLLFFHKSLHLARFTYQLTVWYTHWSDARIKFITWYLIRPMEVQLLHCIFTSVVHFLAKRSACWPYSAASIVAWNVYQAHQIHNIWMAKSSNEWWETGHFCDGFGLRCMIEHVWHCKWSEIVVIAALWNFNRLQAYRKRKSPWENKIDQCIG